MIDFLYEFDAALMVIVGIAVSATLYILEKKQHKNLVLRITFALIIVICISLPVATGIVKYKYSKVPDVIGAISQNAITTLKESDLNVDFNLLSYNGKKLTEYSLNILVVNTKPNKGSIVKKGTTVKLIFGTFDDIRKVRINDNVKVDTLTPESKERIYNYNSRSVTYTPFEQIGIATFGEKGYFYIGGKNMNANVSVSLFDYKTNKKIKTQKTKCSKYDRINETTFSKLKDGKYFYSATLDGYKKYISEPFGIKYEPEKKRDNTNFGLFLQKEDSKTTNKFKIKIKNGEGKVVRNKEVQFRTIDKDNTQLYFQKDYFKTNSNGYLTESGNIICFSISNKNYALQFKYKNQTAILDQFGDASVYVLTLH